MNNELVEKAVDMGRRVGYALVATCDGNGLPHMRHPEGWKRSWISATLLTVTRRPPETLTLGALFG